MKRLIFICFIFIGKMGASQYNDELSSPELLNYDWTLKSPQNDTLLITNVNFPATIHQILFQKKRIADPYYGNNESKLKWIEESDWVAERDYLDNNTTYELKFLTLEGIEPYAKVYVNNKFVFESDNSFKKYSFEISSFLIPQQVNKIKILFESPVRRGKELMSKNPIILPADERVYTRK